MLWDKSTFLNNIQYLIDVHCGCTAKNFNERIGMRDAVTRWKKDEFKPAVETILNICNTFNCSVDWLLTGKDHPQKGDDEFCCWNPEVQEACRELKEILESGDPVAASAIQSNLKAFTDSVRRRKENEKQREEIRTLTKRVKHLEKLHGDGKSAGIDAADDTGIKKKAM